jgi:hypothetical protein
VVRIRTNNERAGDTERNLTFWRAMMRDGRRWERLGLLESDDERRPALGETLLTREE